MKRFQTLTAAMLFAGVTGLTASAAPPDAVDTLAAAPTKAEADTDSAADADENEEEFDDILMVIDLPLVAEGLREDGVSEAEVDEALETAEQAGAPAGDAVDLLDSEADAIKSRGVKKGFAVWAKRHLAKGHHGVVLRQMAKERGDEAELTDAEKEELKAELEKIKAANKARKAAIKAKREAMKASGEAQKLRGEARHEHWRKHAAKKHIEHLKQLKADGNTDPRIDKALRKAKMELKDARGDAKEAREDAKEAHEDAKEAREDAKEAHEDAKEAREDAKEALKEAQKALHGDGDDHKGHKKGDRDGKGPKKGDRDGKGPKDGRHGKKGGGR